jgi:hypothetical protein
MSSWKDFGFQHRLPAFPCSRLLFVISQPATFSLDWLLHEQLAGFHGQCKLGVCLGLIQG